MSRLLARLQSELSATEEPTLRAELVAQIAVYFARQGRFNEAKKAIADIRLHFGAGQSARVAIWMMLAEGIVHYYEAFSPAALDRVARAQVLASALNYSFLIALTSAWKAHIEFETSKFDAMFDSLALALRHAGHCDRDTQTRVAIVLSNALMVCGQHDKANLWFDRGREHAVQNGDQASIEAFLHNRTAFTFGWIRASSCTESVNAETLQRVRMELNSSRNLQEIMRFSSLRNLIHLLDARLLILEEKFTEAIDGLRRARELTPFATYNFNQKYIDLEIAFCLFKRGQPDHALESFKQIGMIDFEKLDIDERMFGEWILSELSANDARFGDAETHSNRLRELSEAYSSQTKLLRGGLAKFVG